MESSVLHELLHDSRAVNASESVLFPLLDKKCEAQVARICARFEGGETDLLTDIAKLVVFRQLLADLKRIQAKGNKASQEIQNGIS